jgi:DNA-binding FadR family transcriptional regulator
MFTNLSRATLPEQIAQQLMDFISTQNLKPGDLLPSEIALTADFGVSRPVVREALKSLAGQGIIEIVNGKGAMIRAIDDEFLRLFFQRAIQIESRSMVELIEVRRPLEVQSARLAAERRTSEEIEQMGKIVEAMRGYPADFEAYADLDVEFHLLIAGATHNMMMYYLISSIRESLKSVMVEGLYRRQTREQLDQVQVMHEAIFREIKARNIEGAAVAMAIHFDETMGFFTTDSLAT